LHCLAAFNAQNAAPLQRPLRHAAQAFSEISGGEF
jgi:hypothetical protein